MHPCPATLRSNNTAAAEIQTGFMVSSTTVQSKTAVILCFCRIFLSAEFQNVEIPQQEQVMLSLNMSNVQCPDSEAVTC